MSSNCNLSPTSFSCCLCLEDNKCDDPDDPQTFTAYLEWIKVHRTNYVKSPTLLRICISNHMCSTEQYESLRNQAIEKRGLDTYTIACPVSGCWDELIKFPKTHNAWDFLIEVCANGHMVDSRCCQRLQDFNTKVCPMCREDLYINHERRIPTFCSTTVRTLDHINVKFDNFLRSYECPYELSRHSDFPSMIRSIFVQPHYALHVAGAPKKVAFVFLLADSASSYEMISRCVKQFLEHWVSALDVINILAPCSKYAFEAISNCIKDIVQTISQQFPAMTASQDHVLSQLVLIERFFNQIDKYVQFTWNVMPNYSSSEVVPESPQPPDVAFQDE